MSFFEAAERWAEADPDPTTVAELRHLIEVGDESGIAARFAGPLRFGTAGLRGPLGAGPARMNRLVVHQAARGILAYLAEQGTVSPTVVIGFDARQNSHQFAIDTAAVVLAAGGRAIVTAGTVPTPLLAYAVRAYGADLGVMVTASHNPPGDNGYKVYLADGAQLVPPHDRAIEAAIDAVDPLDFSGSDDDPPGLERLGRELIDRYLGDVLANPDLSGLMVAYTPLHGVGGALMEQVLTERGCDVHTVESQADPDGNFPTVPFPNPEEPGALDAVLELAESIGADIALAHDPDADRLAVATPGVAGWIPLSGNELGAILADHQLAVTTEPNRMVATTVVSSQLLSKQAAAAGVRFVETLTGFKWVVRPAIEDPESTLVFGYEEALGYAVHPGVRDKDGITAAVAVLERMKTLRESNVTLLERLDELAVEHGVHATGQRTHRFDGPVPRQSMAQVMAHLRTQPPASFGPVAVADSTDFAHRDSGPTTDLLRFDLTDGSRIQLRPSGTEPKLKIYGEVVRSVDAELAATRAAAHRALDALLDAAAALVSDVVVALG